ncbi:MAG: IS200/IS605 family transposase [Dehalococcoidales bacterium]|nr:IS200/IS605 family transposase [Dehalococcoidales bacterium]
MSYWKLFYHFVWTTRDREPLIQPTFASEIYQVIASKATQLGAIVHAVGGTEDRIHLAASVPPSLALSQFVAQVKGNSSHFANHKLILADTFAWQAEYGVLPFDGKQLARVVSYIQGQQSHHARGSTIPVLERSLSEDQT